MSKSILLVLFYIFHYGLGGFIPFKFIWKSATLCASLFISLSDPITPTDRDNQMVQMAFRDFDNKRLDDSDKEFTLAIDRWKDLHRPRDEIVSLLKARFTQYLSTLLNQ
jgi:hypothetical protein